ncbi:MAG: homocysteine S-methyltransferase family protein [Lachnospiraceae bacterium]|nr:homocysteine S-methyltransferase family protein [Lachnospiraceae bacterium]
MDIREYMKDHTVYFDGGMGTMLQARGLMPGELPERWNKDHPDVVTDIHRQYFDAGADIGSANTFGANSFKYNDEELRCYITEGINLVKRAMTLAKNPDRPMFAALDVGPIGRLLKPYGDLDFDEAVAVYSKTVNIGAEAGADLIIIETMNDSYDTKAALLACKESCDLPVIVSNAYGEDGKLMTGATPTAMVAMLEGLGADVIGVNCSLGPRQLEEVVREYLRTASVPVIVQPNAGLPRVENGKTVFDVYPEEFSDVMKCFIEDGVRFAGGCCGTTPEYISETIKKAGRSVLNPQAADDKELTMISSYTHAVIFDKSPILIGERINPTGKKKFKEALRNNDIDYILGEGLRQQEKGVHVLDVNVGLPEIDEPELLDTVTKELQAIINLPLQIDTTDTVAMERALRHYNGKAMINSVNGKEEVMEAVFPLVAKYGGLCVALTLDEGGIPATAKERVGIAEKIIKTAEKYGIKKKDLIFDTLAMAISADTTAALATLGSLNTIKNELGCHTSLGVSNISFGLPLRETITSTFFAIALENGLSAAIMNPFADDMMKTYYSFRALHALDENCGDYIEFATNFVPSTVTVAAAGGTPAISPGSAGASGSGAVASKPGEESPLKRAIIKGLKEKAGAITAEMLAAGADPLEIVSGEVIPALDTVGEGFEKKTMFLPQLLMSAEASQYAFEQIKLEMNKRPGESVSRGKFVIATVKGDIHDIGKNIVKLLLENYGFDVEDLGRDVPPETVVEAVKRTGAKLVGLSALMTTTVPAMEETIKLLRTEAPEVKIVVGGAVLTQEYADKIGADHYAKDAMATVRYACEQAENA